MHIFFSWYCCCLPSSFSSSSFYRSRFIIIKRTEVRLCIDILIENKLACALLDWAFETERKKKKKKKKKKKNDCWLIFIDIIVSLRPSVYMLVLTGETRNQNNMCIDREHWYIKKTEEKEATMFLLNIIHALGIR